ncbi:MAG: TonB family protein [Taibaiella sp.]|nr:TonB family protein [Taibaiella sp.]
MMETQTNTYLDLVFQNRNKAYGAYELRKNYNKRMIRAGMLVIIGFGLLAFCQGATERAKAELPDKVSLSPPVVIDRIGLPKEKKQTEYPKPIGDLKPLQATTAQKVQTGQFTDPLIVKNDRVKPEEKIENPSRMTNIGPERKDGAESGPNTIYRKEGAWESEGVLNKGDTMESKTVPDLPIRNGVDRKAEYVGNMKSFLSGHLRYPQVAMVQKIEGEVVLEFIVDKHGQVSSIKVLKGIGGGCDEEAVRVVSKMKDWKPAQKNGTDVATYFLLPIQFELD